MSVDYKKLHGAHEVKAMMRHCQTDQRLIHEHSNKQIDLSQTNRNVMFGALKDYQEACDVYDNIIAELDAVPTQRYVNKSGKEVNSKVNSRKDRVTCFGLSITAPAEFDEAKAIEWAEKVYADFQLNNKVIGGALHFDEVHEYTDPDTKEKRTSRPHLHLFVVPVSKHWNTEGKQFNRLNGKEFSSRANINKANKRVNEISKDMGGTFLTGEKKKSRGSVEMLKNRTEVIEAEQLAEKTIKKAQEASQSLIEANEKQAKELKDREDDLEIKISNYNKDKEELKLEQDYQQNRADYLDKQLAELDRQAQIKAQEERRKALADLEERDEKLKEKEEFYKRKDAEVDKAIPIYEKILTIAEIDAQRIVDNGTDYDYQEMYKHVQFQKQSQEQKAFEFMKLFEQAKEDMPKWGKCFDDYCERKQERKNIFQKAKDWFNSYKLQRKLKKDRIKEKQYTGGINWDNTVVYDEYKNKEDEFSL